MLKKELNSFKNFFSDSVEFAKKSFNDFFSRFRDKKVTVETEVKGAEQIEQAKQKLESLPKTKTLEVKVEKKGDFSGLGLSGKNTEKTISLKSEVAGLDQVNQLSVAVDKLPEEKTIAVPPVSQWSKMKGVFGSLRSGINDVSDGLKNIGDRLLSKGGGLLIMYEGVKSLVERGNHFRNSRIQRMKEAAMPNLNLSRIPEAVQTI